MSEVRTNTISAANGTDPVTLTKQSAAQHFSLVVTSNTINKSLNLASIVDEGTGRIKYNFTNAFDSRWYAYASHNMDGGGHNDGSGANTSDSDTPTASVMYVFTHHNGSANDSEGGVGLTVTGDLA